MQLTDGLMDFDLMYVGTGDQLPGALTGSRQLTD
jgi:hypothetical protein